MCKFVNNGKHSRIDKCMKTFVKELNRRGIKTYMCCCGHGKYNPSCLVIHSKFKNHITDLFSGIGWWNKRRFYKRDKQGYYYIPEVVNKINS